MENNERIDRIIEIKKAQKRAKKENNAKMFQKYLVILLYLKGKKNADEIAEICGVSRRTVYNYIELYTEKGIDGLTPKKHKGVEQKLPKEYEEELKNIIINKYPSDCGFPIDYNWTSILLCQYVENKYGVKYSRSGMNAFLIRKGFSYTRATYTLAKADPIKQEEFKKEFEEIKKNS